MRTGAVTGGVAVLMLAVLGACSSTPVRIQSHALADLQPNAAVGAASVSGREGSISTRVIVAVDNNAGAFFGRAGSTPRGYDALATYGPSASAMRQMHDIESEYGLREVNAWPIEPLHMHCAVLEVPAGQDSTAVLTRLAQDPRVKLAEPMQTFATRTENYNDPYVGLQRGFEQMDVADAHPLSRGEGVRVAIIDTGADTRHPDLRGAIVSADNFVDADEAQFRQDRHGTEVAGVIAAAANNREGIVGVAPAARIMLYKACWQASADADAASCNSFTIARALVAAFDAHAQVVNLSLAGPADALLSGLIQEGVRRGILFVGASAAATPVSGAGLLHQPGIIEVATVEGRSAIDATLFAPGREILTLLPGGHYDFASGASIATAQVTGVVALLLARNRALSGAEAYRLLHETSARSASIGGSADRVDACAALSSMMGHGSCRQFTPSDTPFGNTTTERVALH